VTAQASNDQTFTVTANGESMGTYSGADQAAALDAYARDAGYTDYSSLVEAHPDGADDAGIEIALADEDEQEPPTTIDDLVAAHPEFTVRSTPIGSEAVIVNKKSCRVLIVCEGDGGGLVWTTSDPDCDIDHGLDAGAIDTATDLSDLLAWVSA